MEANEKGNEKKVEGEGEKMGGGDGVAEEPWKLGETVTEPSLLWLGYGCR